MLKPHSSKITVSLGPKHNCQSKAAKFNQNMKSEWIKEASNYYLKNKGRKKRQPTKKAVMFVTDVSVIEGPVRSMT